NPNLQRSDSNLRRLDDRSNDGITPLFIAAQSGYTEIAAELLKYGANCKLTRVNDQASPLFMASQNNHRDVAELLIKHGADVNLPLKKGDSCLTIASFNGNKEIVALLLQHGADLNQKALGHFTALDNARSKKYYEIISMLEKAMNIQNSE